MSETKRMDTFTGSSLACGTSGPASVGISHRRGAGPSLRRRNWIVIRAAKKICELPHAAAATAQGDRRARSESAGRRSQRRTLAQENAQSARGGMAGAGNSSWDQGLPPERAAQKFVEQCLEDVDAAISRLFATLPDTDEIVLRVLDPTSGDPIVAGTVTRAEAVAAAAGSVGMKLKSMGLVYRLVNWQFESLTN